MQNNQYDTKCQFLTRDTPGGPGRSAQQDGQDHQGERSESLLYLNSNNTDESLKNTSKLTPYHHKKAHVLEKDVDKFVQEVGINNILFLTLTFADNVTCSKEAYRRFNNLNRRFLSVFFGRWMLVKERQERGAWHYHIIVETLFDVRTGFDFDAMNYIGFWRTQPGGWKKYGKLIKKYERILHRSASPGLKSVWQLLNNSMKKYGFGRPHAAPIKTNVEAISKYVGKYIAKHQGIRKPEDKGVRLTSTSKGFINSTPKFAWNTEGGKEWRRKLKQFALLIGIKDMTDMAYVFGPRWAYHWEYSILSVDTITPPEISRFKKIVKKKRSGIRNNRTILNNDNQLMDLTTGEVLF